MQQDTVFPSIKTDFPDTNNQNKLTAIFVMYEDGKWGMNEHFEKLDAVFDPFSRLGWWIPIKHKDTIEQLCKNAEMSCIEEKTILPAKNWDDFKYQINLQDQESKLLNLQSKINDLKQKLKIEKHDNNAILNNKELEKTSHGKDLIDAIKENMALEANIIRIKNENLVANITGITNINTIPTIEQLLKEQDNHRAQYQGKDYIGLPQSIIDTDGKISGIPLLDEYLSGLRKFILIAAAPNVGKTAITIQLALNTLGINLDTCLLFVSCEMSAHDILARMRCHLTPMAWKKLYFGGIKEDGTKGWYTNAESEDLNKSKEMLSYLSNRMRILDQKSFPNMSAETIIAVANDLKKSSGFQHIVIVIDYLHVFPIPDNVIIRGDLDADQYRSKQMKNIRDAIGDDPLIVISEKRKQASGGSDTFSIDDIMGSARAGYQADAVILLNTLSTKDLTDEQHEILNKKGISYIRLEIVKARDGMQRGTILLAFHYRENQFKQTTQDDIEELLGTENIEKMLGVEKKIPKQKKKDKVDDAPKIVQANFPNMTNKGPTSNQSSIVQRPKTINMDWDN